MARLRAVDTAGHPVVQERHYADIGAAVAMTRQGARRRWPGLAEVTRTARSATPPPQTS